MKKITLCLLAASFMLAVTPGQTKAATEDATTKSSVKSAETVSVTEPLNEIKSINLSSLSTSENSEVLKESSPLTNEQGRHNGRLFNNRRDRDVGVTIRDDGYRHRHSGAYIGGGGVIVLIIILILIL